MVSKGTRISFQWFCAVLGIATLLLTASSRLTLPTFSLPSQPLRPPAPRTKPRITGDHDVYLCGVVRGRVGNALFAYMSLLGIARTNNMTLLLKDESVLPEVLEHSPETSPDFDTKCAGVLYMPQRRCCVFDKSLVTLPHDDRYLISSCLISWKYFEGIRAEVKSRLEFRRDVLAEAKKIVEQLRQQTDNATLVGVHVRRGDQAGVIAYWNGHNPVTPEYMERAMQYFTDRFQHVHFLVASQDTYWCRKYVSRNRNDVTIMVGNSAALDIAALTLTDHMIISIGTFGWWAGYLNPGIKTYMKNFIGPESSFSKSFDDLNATDYIYPEWVGL